MMSRGLAVTSTAFYGLRQKLCWPQAVRHQSVKVSRHQGYLFSILHLPPSPTSTFTFYYVNLNDDIYRPIDINEH